MVQILLDMVQTIHKNIMFMLNYRVTGDSTFAL